MKDGEIHARTNRVEEIIQTIEEGEVSLEEAKELREEAQTLIDGLEEDLEVGDGSVEVVNE